MSQNFSHVDKVLWPQEGYTKGDLIAYYQAVSTWMLPYLKNRPLTLQRFPNGIEGESFFEKNAPRGVPEWVHTVTIASESEPERRTRFVVCNDERTLLYLANLAAIMLHIWTSREQSLDVPDFMMLDLDPDEECTLAVLARTALRFRSELSNIGLTPLVKTSGGSGLHLIVPLAPVYTYDIVRAFSELAARRVHAVLADSTSLERMPAKRARGTVYLDFPQVGKGKTLVAPFSVRARAKAPVSMPIAWEEVEEMGRSRARDICKALTRYNLANVPGLLARSGDPWAGNTWKEQRLEEAFERADQVWRVEVS